MRIRSTAMQQGELREVLGTCFFVLFVEQVIDNGAMRNNTSNNDRNEEVEMPPPRAGRSVGREAPSHRQPAVASVLRQFCARET